MVVGRGWGRETIMSNKKLNHQNHSELIITGNIPLLSSIQFLWEAKPSVANNISGNKKSCKDFWLLTMARQCANIIYHI